MAKPLFAIDNFDNCDKYIPVQGPGDLQLEVYYDDCDHEQVAIDTKKMVAILNKHWND